MGWAVVTPRDGAVRGRWPPGGARRLASARRQRLAGAEALAGGVDAAAPGAPSRARAPAVPEYLYRTYRWAYLNPRSLAFFDRPLVVSVILWGKHRRLSQAALAEIEPGQKVLQAACVYGNFTPALARRLGPRGSLDVIDVSPLQVANCRRKLEGFPRARVWLADAAAPGGGPYDAVCCFFLLHEMPDDYKRAVVDALLASLVAGGKAVFVDYHRPHWAHPLKAVMSLVFALLEPFAKSLWANGIASYARYAGDFSWRKRTFFGGLYQVTVARRRNPSEAQAR